MELSNQFLNKMEQLNKLSKRLGFGNFRGWADKQLSLKKINPVEFDRIDIYHQMRNIIAHGFSGRVIVFQEDIDKLNEYLKLINKELGFEIDDIDLGMKETPTIDSTPKERPSNNNGYKTGNGKKANKQVIVDYIKGVLEEARKQGKPYIILRAGDVEKAVGLSQRIVSVCHAMYDCKTTKDEVLSTTPSGYSTTITIKYYL